MFLERLIRYYLTLLRTLRGRVGVSEMKLGPDKREGYRRVGIVEGYDRWALTYDSQPNALIIIEEDSTLNLIGNVRNKKVLDIGCGTGRYCELLAKRGARVVGIDPSLKMLEYAKRKIAHDCRFELYCRRVEDIELPSSHFDIVVSALTFGHIPHLNLVMKEVSRVIKKGGRLVVSDIHPYWPISGHDYAEFFDEKGQEYRIPEYSHLLEEYWTLFRRYGLRLEAVKEPRVDDRLIKIFPNLREYRGLPLAMILKARKT
jgi:ubiquinone/menaquinone biosynthesis C-methylase UbiE